MKKILLLIMAFVFSLSLVACGNDEKTEDNKTNEVTTPEPEKVDDTTFEQYLKKASSFKREDLDNLLKVEGNEEVVVPEIKLDTLKVPTTKASLSGDAFEAPMEAYLFQEDKVIYGLQGNQGAFKLDLAQCQAELDSLINQVLPEEGTETPELTMKPSEALDSLLLQLKAQAGIQTELNTDTLLGLINFELKDFKDEGNGVYSLTKEALIAKISNALKTILGEETANGLIPSITAVLTQLEELRIALTYGNGRIRGFEFRFKLGNNFVFFKIDSEFDSWGIKGSKVAAEANIAIRQRSDFDEDFNTIYYNEFAYAKVNADVTRTSSKLDLVLASKNSEDKDLTMTGGSMEYGEIITENELTINVSGDIKTGSHVSASYKDFSPELPEVVSYDALLDIVLKDSKFVSAHFNLKTKKGDVKSNFIDVLVETENVTVPEFDRQAAIDLLPIIKDAIQNGMVQQTSL